MRKLENKYHFNIFLDERGFTLIEAVVASTITATTLVLIMVFSIRTFDISTKMNAINDINHSIRRTQEAFSRDVKMAQYFFFGAEVDNEGNQFPKKYIDRRELTLGYKDFNDELIWIRYDVVAGSKTGLNYLLRTSNELYGGTEYQTSILASDVDDMYLTFFNEYDFEITLAEDVRRIEMTLVLSDKEITEKAIISSTLRGENKGIDIPNKNLREYQDTNFVK